MGAQVGLTRFLSLLLLLSVWVEDPLSAERRTQLQRELDEAIRQNTKLVEQDGKNIAAYSKRGDAYFFRGDFNRAISDYDKMLELNPKLAATHWQRGLACFYAKEFQKAADQFAAYHTYDNRDRENGIWHYFSNAKARGIPAARQRLFQYERFDREPFPSLYRLVEGTVSPADVLAEIASANMEAAERDKRLFYAHLYIGLNYAIQDKPDLAAKHLREATRSTWAPHASYGATFMWHVGRLHYDLLAAMPANS